MPTPQEQENSHLSDEQKAQLAATAYYARASETGELLAVMLQGLGTPLHAISIIGAKIVSVALTLVAQHDRDTAIQMRDELAQGFVEMLSRLNLSQNDDPESTHGTKN